MSNVIRCEKCGCDLIMEEFPRHKCEVRIPITKTLNGYFDYFAEITDPKTGEKILMVKSAKGILYSFRQLPPNPNTLFRHPENQQCSCMDINA